MSSNPEGFAVVFVSDHSGEFQTIQIGLQVRAPRRSSSSRVLLEQGIVGLRIKVRITPQHLRDRRFDLRHKIIFIVR